LDTDENTVDMSYGFTTGKNSCRHDGGGFDPKNRASQTSHRQAYFLKVLDFGL
jgi:hypothetical protein